MNSTDPRYPARLLGSAAPAIHGPAEIVAAVPYLLGFQPEDSVVILGIRRDGTEQTLVATARLDISAAETPVLRDTLMALTKAGAVHAVTLTYARPFDTRIAVGLLVSACRDSGIRLLDSLVVADGRWRSALCSDERCCPPAGSPEPERVTELQAAATYAGVHVAASRDELADRLAPQPGRDHLVRLIEQAEFSRLTAEASGDMPGWRRNAVRAIHRAARTAATPGISAAVDDRAAARLAVALNDTTVRDRIWLAIDAQRLPRSPLWVDLARRVPSPHDAAPYFLHAWQSWRAGDGATAGIAVARTLDADPAYSAAQLLTTALERGLSPHRFPALRSPRTRRTGRPGQD